MSVFTRETFPTKEFVLSQPPTVHIQPASDNPPNVQVFRMDYQHGVYVIISIDVNNYYDTSGTPTNPGTLPWLIDWTVYQNGTPLYLLSDLAAIVIESMTGSFPFNDPYNMTLNPGVAFWTNDANLYPNFYNLMSIDSLGYYNMETFAVTYAYPCFKEGSTILTDQGYKRIEELKKGDKIQTLKHGFVSIDMLGRREIFHPANEARVIDQLYKCSPSAYPELTEDLILTGAHSILVANYKNKEEEQRAIEINKGMYVTDGKARLPAAADERAMIYETAGNYMIYHIALENSDYYMNYGIYANGLLVETCSKRYLKELSHMTLLE